MRTILVALMGIAACGGSDEPANPDSLLIDSADAQVDAERTLYGEPCELPNLPEYPQAVALCHERMGFCVDMNDDGAGECRPWCDQISPNWNPTYACLGSKEGGVPTWTTDGTSTEDGPFLCVCVPAE